MLVKFESSKIYLLTLFVFMMMQIAGAASATEYCGVDLTPVTLDFGSLTVPYDAAIGDNIGSGTNLHITKSCAGVNGSSQIPRYRSINPLSGTHIWQTDVPGIGIKIAQNYPIDRFISTVSPGDGYKNLFSEDDDGSLENGNYVATLVRVEGNVSNGVHSINVMNYAMYDIASNSYSNNRYVTARFTIQTQSCSEADNSDTQSPIVLPSISRNEINSQISGTKSFTLRIKCNVPDGTGLKIYLTDVQSPENVTANLTTKGVKNVALRILRDGYYVIFGEAGGWRINEIQNNSVDVPMTVGYVATGDVESGGAISAQAAISFEYY